MPARHNHTPRSSRPMPGPTDTDAAAGIKA
jgi:hypothetical protein